MFSEATRQFIQQHRYDDVRQLALHTNILSGVEVDIAHALTQIAGRQLIEHKLPSWYELDSIIYPVRISLEQCSSELTARYKASLLSGKSFVDLTGGFGVDCAFIAKKFHEATYVERQKELCEIVACNFSSLKLDHIKVENIDTVDYLREMSPVDCIFIDPARRSETGRKTVAISDCEPNLNEIQDVLMQKAGYVLVKLSPMLDISLALKSLRNVYQVHVVSVGNECKELLFLMREDYASEPEFICVNLKAGRDQVAFSSLQSEEKETKITCTPEVKKYLYEPNASILKAGFYKKLAAEYNVDKLHSDSHLYTSESFLPDFPGRIFQIEDVVSMNKKELKSAFQGETKANIATRNFPISVAELRKKLKLKEGGEIYLFATTLANGKHVLLKTIKSI